MIIDGITVMSWAVSIMMTVLVGTCMYISMLDKCYEQPSVKHGRFWLCQGIAALVALCIYLTKIGIIVWQ
jgi:hypothetical protein